MSRASRVQSYDDGHDSWHVERAAPDAALGGAVDHYADYTEHTGSFTARRELASTDGVMIVNLGDPLDIVGADGAAITLAAGEGFVAGAAAATSISRSTGAQSGVHVSAPLSILGRIAGCPAGMFANRALPLDALIGPAIRDLGGRLVDASSSEQRFRLLDVFLRGRAGPAADDARMECAAVALRRAPGRRIDALADALNLDRRRFARLFRQATGFAPRHFARIARFQRFAAAIAAAPDTPLADLAAAAGYFDQPHLNRDVRDFASMSPTELRARILPQGFGVRHE